MELYLHSPNAPSWRGAQLKHRDNFIFTFTCSKFRIGKHLSDSFPIQNGLKQTNVLKPLFFNLSVGYGIRKVQEMR
jgi:hypothetical protein